MSIDKKSDWAILEVCIAGIFVGLLTIAIDPQGLVSTGDVNGVINGWGFYVPCLIGGVYVRKRLGLPYRGDLLMASAATIFWALFVGMVGAIVVAALI